MTKYVEDSSSPDLDQALRRECHWELRGPVLQLVGSCPRCHFELNYKVQVIWVAGLMPTGKGLTSRVLKPKKSASCACLEPIENRETGVVGCGAIFSVIGMAMPTAPVPVAGPANA